MTTKNFNAKKMLMSTLAAVVFSFVFTTNAGASTLPLGEASKCVEAHKCSSDKKQDQKKQEKQEEEDDSKKGFITYFLEKVFGIK